MGGFANVATQVGGGIFDGMIGGGGLVGNLIGTVTAERQRKALLEQSYADMQRRSEALNAQYGERERRRLDLLHRKEASGRALYSALGIDPSAGSAAAVLRGFAEEADAEASADARQRDLSLASLAANADGQHQQALWASEDRWAKTALGTFNTVRRLTD